ncbi:MAG: hypothetical protein P0S95_00015 [Rhabdochlamydiaceae bacterium]|nr:hypothetical protein [Candidatus Amphrikana amoebophyrae]
MAILAASTVTAHHRYNTRSSSPIRYFEPIPLSVISKILSFIPQSDLAVCLSVSSAFKVAGLDNTVWQKFSSCLVKYSKMIPYYNQVKDFKVGRLQNNLVLESKFDQSSDCPVVDLRGLRLATSVTLPVGVAIADHTVIHAATNIGLIAISRPQDPPTIELYDIKDISYRGSCKIVARFANETLHSLSDDGLMTSLSETTLLVRNLSAPLAAPLCSYEKLDADDTVYTSPDNKLFFGKQGQTFHLYSPDVSEIDLRATFRSFTPFAHNGQYFCFGTRRGSDKFCLDHVDFATTTSTELLAFKRTSASTSYECIHIGNVFVILNTNLRANQVCFFSPEDLSFKTAQILSSTQLTDLPDDEEFRIDSVTFNNGTYLFKCATDSSEKTRHYSYNPITKKANFFHYEITGTLHDKFPPLVDQVGSICFKTNHSKFTLDSTSCEPRVYSIPHGAQSMVWVKNVLVIANTHGDVRTYKFKPKRRSPIRSWNLKRS